MVLGSESCADRDGGVVRMEAVKRGGLWEIETVGKQRAFLVGFMWYYYSGNTPPNILFGFVAVRFRILAEYPS